MNSVAKGHLDQEAFQTVLAFLHKRLEFPKAAAHALLGEAEAMQLERGDLLFEQGDASDSFYLLLSGKLKGERLGSKGTEFKVWFLPGDIIGELGFFGQSERTLRLMAVRPSLLLKVDQRVLDQAASSSELVYQHILRILTRRFKSQMGYSRRRSQKPLILLKSYIGQGAAQNGTAGQFGNLYQACLDDLVSALQNAGQARVSGSLDALELGLASLGSGKSSAQVFVTAHADPVPTVLMDELDMLLVLRITDSGNRQALIEEISALRKDADESLAVTVIHLHPSGLIVPGETEGFEALGTGVRHMHWRKGCQEDVDRIARIAGGRGFGLVLGGGGARGFAHAGVFRALAEACCLPDFVGGTSMGALVGALIASGLEPEGVEHTLKTTFKKGLPFRWRDYLFPKHGFIRSGSVDRVYRDAFGSQRIEDLPIPFYAIGCNLSTGGEELITTAEVWKSIRATTSIPVLFEPYATRQEIWVDGALVNNVPVDRMRELGAEYILTVDVGQEEEIRVEGEGVRERQQLPSLLKSLMRMVELGGLGKSRQAAAMSDFFIKPDLGKFAMLDFDQAGPIIDAGYEAAQGVLQSLGQQLGRKLTSQGNKKATS